MTSNGRRLRICEKCGGEFSCGAASGRCWCLSVPLETEVLESLKQNYDDCLCGTCLEGYRSNKKQK